MDKQPQRLIENFNFTGLLDKSQENLQSVELLNLHFPIFICQSDFSTGKAFFPKSRGVMIESFSSSSGEGIKQQVFVPDPKRLGVYAQNFLN
ncbi:hypothetical protein YC2023_049214 [Brassica napus]